MNQPVFFYDHFMSGMKRYEFPGLGFYRVKNEPARVSGRLFVSGDDPAMVASEKGDDYVAGELHYFTDTEKVLKITDRIEKCNSKNPEKGRHVRVMVQAYPEGSKIPVQAWAYIFNGDIKGLRRIASGNWRDEAPRA